MANPTLFLHVLSTDVLLQERWLPLVKDPKYLCFHPNPTILLNALETMAGAVIIDSGCKTIPTWTDNFWVKLSTHTRWIFATTQPTEEEGLQVLNLGAAGYCHLYSSLPTWRQVLEVVADGELWVGKQILSRLLVQLNHTLQTSGMTTSNDGKSDSVTPDIAAWEVGLTTREIEVAKRAAWGDSNAVIADALGITERTVKSHLSAIFEKLHISDRLQLALQVHGIRK